MRQGIDQFDLKFFACFLLQQKIVPCEVWVD